MDGSTRRMSPELAERFEREAMQHRGQLLRFARQLTRHGQDAEDLVQDAITRACAPFTFLSLAPICKRGCIASCSTLS